MKLSCLLQRPLSRLISNSIKSKLETITNQSRTYHSAILITTEHPLSTYPQRCNNIHKQQKASFSFTCWDDEEAMKARYERVTNLYNEDDAKYGNKNSEGAWQFDRRLDWDDVYPRTIIDELLDMGYKITHESPQWLRQSKYANQIKKSKRRKKKVYGYYTKKAKEQRAQKNLDKKLEKRRGICDEFYDDLLEHGLKHCREKEDVTVAGTGGGGGRDKKLQEMMEQNRKELEVYMKSQGEKGMNFRKMLEGDKKEFYDHAKRADEEEESSHGVRTRRSRKGRKR